MGLKVVQARRLHVRSVLLVALAVWGSLLVLSDPAAAAENDGDLGGPPLTNTDSTACPTDKAVLSVTGSLATPGGNTVVRSVTVECEDGAAATGTMGTDDITAPLQTTNCGQDEVAVGIEGREGDFVDFLALRCRAADLTGPITSAISGYGGIGGGPDGPYDCPDGQRLSGLTGTVTDDLVLVRHLEIQCFTVPRVSDGRLGGPPTQTSASTGCAASNVVTGFTGRVGNIGGELVGSVSAECDYDTIPPTGVMGSPGNPFGATDCAAGQVAVGIAGREGEFLDNLSVRCRASTLTGSITTATGYGGSGGTVDGPYDCPSGFRLTGLTGSTIGGTVKHVEIVCTGSPTFTTVSVTKTATKAKASGSVQPDQPGDDVTVKLQRRRSNGTYKTLATKTAVLDADSNFRAGFRRAEPGRCRILATYAGDSENQPSSATDNFRC